MLGLNPVSPYQLILVQELFCGLSNSQVSDAEKQPCFWGDKLFNPKKLRAVRICVTRDWGLCGAYVMVTVLPGREKKHFLQGILCALNPWLCMRTRGDC